MTSPTLPTPTAKPTTVPVRAFVAFGSNLGDSAGNVETARTLLGVVPGVRIVRKSSIIRTFPVGGPKDQPIFANAVDEIETTLDPFALLAATQGVERALRRVRAVRWGPRTIDLDLLLYGDSILSSPTLTIPHSRIVWRDFVLRPLCEIAPTRRLPTTGLTFEEHRRLLSVNFASFEVFVSALRSATGGETSDAALWSRNREG